MLTNLLDVSLQIFEVNGEIPLGFLEQFIGILISAVGLTGLGIILYCLILKVAILPLDVWQKATMRKQSLKMNSMRAQLEKLQKQYANAPELYQKKIQEVYKENNFNMFASCLPMIATLVVLIFAFRSLTLYSQHMNLKTYTGMASAYNTAIMAYCDQDADKLEYADDNNYYIVKSDDAQKFVYYLEHKTSGQREYKIDTAKLMSINAELTSDSECLEYVKTLGRTAAADSYEKAEIDFLWIKNIYYPDVAWANPLQTYDNFCNSINEKIHANGAELTIKEFIDENVYGEITHNLTEQKTQPNGFFILVVLTILANLGSQFITMRSQKDQRELQSADPSAQNMQKWMMFLMPAMFCVFAFIYSAAFSLYLITSALFSLVSTLVVNKIIDALFNKKQEAEQRAQVQYGGRKALTRDWARNKEIMGETTSSKAKDKKKDKKD
ncbi:MAG: membrane protein insertase YidC [Clostridia bacterium]|nr:membrane protein insertase YidC [Clostridia bacterium]